MLQVAVFGARLLARLSVVGAVAKFQEAAEELARMHALNASPDSPATQVCSSAHSLLPSSQLGQVCRQCTVLLIAASSPGSRQIGLSQT